MIKIYQDLMTSGRSVSDLKAHLVLTTKYRKKLFTKVMLVRLDEIFKSLLDKWGCKYIEFNGESDHIHLLFQYTPQVSLSKLVNNIKTVSSRYIKKEFSDRFNKIYRNDSMWNGSYYISSCGGVTVDVLRKYIEDQDEPKR